MKKLIPFILLFTVLFSCQTKPQKQTLSTDTSSMLVVAPENLAELKFDVRGMSCTGCENTINKSVKALPGIAEVKSSYIDSFTLVKFDKTKTNAEAIKQAIESKGYTVRGFSETKE